MSAAAAASLGSRFAAAPASHYAPSSLPSKKMTPTSSHFSAAARRSSRRRARTVVTTRASIAEPPSGGGATEDDTKERAKVSMVSLGCPKNTVDGEVMLGDLFANGFDITDDHDESDAIIINTCGFVEVRGRGRGEKGGKTHLWGHFVAVREGGKLSVTAHEKTSPVHSFRRH